jgi:hypothetical protein
MTPYSLADFYQRFPKSCCVHLQGRWRRQLDSPSRWYTALHIFTSQQTSVFLLFLEQIIPNKLTLLSPSFPFRVLRSWTINQPSVRNKSIVFLVHTITRLPADEGSQSAHVRKHHDRDAAWFFRWIPTFRRNRMAPSSRYKRKPWIASASAELIFLSSKWWQQGPLKCSYPSARRHVPEGGIIDTGVLTTGLIQNII